jgi:hypothetical protein
MGVSLGPKENLDVESPLKTDKPTDLFRVENISVTMRAKSRKQSALGPQHSYGIFGELGKFWAKARHPLTCAMVKPMPYHRLRVDAKT